MALHKALAAGQDVTSAARTAQLHLKSNSSGDPTWAAFCVLQGNASRKGGST
jgi:hypothetical protein